MSNIFAQLQAQFPRLDFQAEALLAPFTSIKIGGPAEVLISITETDTLISVIQFCHESSIPVTLLGWGANTLIADRGLRGLVIRNMTKELTVEDQLDSSTDTQPVSARHTAISPDVDFSPLDYQEAEGTPRVGVTVAGGWPLPTLIASLLGQGITGLQWYARIPATMAGAVVNNIHGGTHFLSEVIDSVRVINQENTIIQVPADQCSFGYDYSRFHTTSEVIVDVRLRLWRGDAEKARSTVAEWAKRKSLQPQQSLGCTFQNLSTEQQKKLDLPTTSTGYLIDQVLQLKGTVVGGAQISPRHAAFIENTGTATAQDYLELAHIIQSAAQQKLGIQLKPEIFFKGFTSEELGELASNYSR